MVSPTHPLRKLSLDGIRGVAIALVIVHHTFQWIEPTPGFSSFFMKLSASAWIGVDLFFVLSGYLICGILLKSRDQEGYFPTFYIRRIFRIFPLYYATLASLFLLSVVMPHSKTKLDLLWNGLFLSNIDLAMNGWPWKGIAHLWSLSVEEQFYLVWPALIYLMPRRRTLTAIGCGFLLLVVIRQYAVYLGTGSVALYATLHMDGLLLGSALAAFYRRHLIVTLVARRIAWAALLIFTTGLSVQGLGHGLDWRQWDGLQYLNYSLVAAWGAAFLTVSLYSDESSLINRCLKFRPLLILGKYSFAIYLFHQPIDAALRRANLHPSTVALTFPYALLVGTASLLCALVSWKFLEEPCLRFRDRWFPQQAPALNTSPVMTDAADQPELMQHRHAS